ncbi:MAG: Ig domain-containing protein [Lachnospiraceae bacterium]|nr:Ig domain-containing protein [Lachnospiraceae bacterium]
MELERVSGKEFFNSFRKKVLTAVLTVSLVLGAAPQMSLPVYALPDNNANYAKTGGVSLVADGVASAIGNPKEGAGGWSYVWFGNYKQNKKVNEEFVSEPIKWKVLQNSGIAGGKNENSTDRKLFLLSDTNLDVVKYNENQADITWATCTIRDWLNNLENNPYKVQGFSFINDAFINQEQAAIAETDVKTDRSKDTSDRVFLLSVAEALDSGYGFDNYGAVNTAYVHSGGKTGSDGMSPQGETNEFWLRSPGDNSYKTAKVLSPFICGDVNVSYPGVAVCPALNIDLKSLLFTSLISGTTNQYKLTIKDDKINLAIGEGVVTSGNTVTVPYKISGDDNTFVDHVTLIMTEGEYQKKGAILKHYEAKPISTATGTVTFTLPDDYNENWKVYILAEDINGEYETNYASAPVSVASKPVIRSQPNQTGKIIYGDPANRNLSVVANSPDGGTLSYQWYKNTTNSATGGLEITGATNPSFTIPGTESTGTHYYYCVVTNTIGISSALTVSDVVTVTIDPADVNIDVKSVTLDVATVTLECGQTYTFAPVISPANATDKTLTWKTGNKKVATVSADGTVTGVGKGTTRITATSSNGKTATCKVRVKEYKDIKRVYITPSSVRLKVGKTRTVRAIILPKDAQNRRVIWKSSNARVATVTPVSSSKAKIIAVGKGTARITVTTADSKKKRTIKVIVKKK